MQELQNIKVNQRGNVNPGSRSSVIVAAYRPNLTFGHDNKSRCIGLDDRERNRRLLTDRMKPACLNAM
jgi:hypothetical protein